MKRFICILLVLALMLPLSGCIGFGPKPVPTDPPATAEPTEAATSAPTDAPTAEPTEEPTPDPEAANDAFRELDLEIFRELVTSGADSFHQYVVGDPAAFGIDPADVQPGWGDLTYEAHSASMDYFREVLERLEEIDYENLNEMNRHGYDAIKRAFQKELMFEDYYYYDEPLEPINGTQTMMILSMVLFDIRCAEDVETYLLLIEDMPRYIGQLEQFEDEKAEQGLFMTETALDEVLESIDNIVDKGEDSVLISYFEDDVIAKAKELGVTDAECEALAERNRAAVLEGVLPAFAQLRDALEAHRDDCRKFTGACRVSDKMLNYYKAKLRYEGATMDTVDTIVGLLEDMGDSVYYDIVYGVTYGPDDLFDRLDDPITFGSVVENVEWLESFIEDYYPALPDHELEYREVPADIADDFSPAAYLTPAFDDYYHNVMLVNPTEESATDLFTVAHETLPGHMFQFLYSRNMEGLPLTQQILEPTGYAEGWTVFTEYFVANNCYEKDNYVCMVLNADATFTNIFLPAYVSVLVNIYGYTKNDVRKFLNEFNMGEGTDVLYEYAITMPFYAMNYAIGYAYLRSIFEEVDPKGPTGCRMFFERYLSFGPCDMDMMKEYMK